jgi:hypothetical protein
MCVSYNAIKTYMSLVPSQDVPSLLGHLQATPFVEETLYCTLIGCYFHYYYFPFFLIFLSLFLVCGVHNINTVNPRRTKDTNVSTLKKKNMK